MRWERYHTRQIQENYLFKFLSLQHLKNFLETGKIWFSRADQFGDKMECIRIQDLKAEAPNYTVIEKRKQRFLISCWHLCDNESLALWDTYADTKEKRRTTAIRFKRIDLTYFVNEAIFRNNSFYYQTKWVHGKIIYRNLINAKRDDLNNYIVKFPAFRKESAFKYENEYRFVIELKNPTGSTGFGYHIGNPKQLAFDILINPLLNKEEYKTIRNEIVNAGFDSKIIKSPLERWLKPEVW